jgi:hypothetical protein
VKRGWALRVAGAGLLLGALGACQPELPPPHAARPTPSAAARPKAVIRASLADYVPAAGLRWMLLGEPERLLSHPDLGPSLAALLPPERLLAYARSTGVELRQVKSACVAGFDRGVLYLANVPPPTARARDAFMDRLLTDPAISVPGEKMVLVQGLIGTQPQAFLDVEPSLVSVATGDPSLIRVVIGYATGRLQRSPSALSGAALSGLPRPKTEPALRFLAPGPFVGQWQKGVHGLLTNTFAVDVRVSPDDHGGLALELLMLGDYPAEVADTQIRVEESLAELTGSTLGSLLGLSLLEPPPSVTVAAGLITVRATVPIAPLLHGLQAAVSAEVWQLMDLSPAPTAASASQPPG